MRTPSRPLRAFALAALPVVALLPATTSTAAPLTTDPAVAATLAASWLADQVNAEGFVPGPTNTPDVSATLEVALALASSRSQEPTFNRIVAWLVPNSETAIAKSGNDDPGRLGYLLMIADIAGVPPTNFGGVNLNARLDGTFNDFAPGLYGGADPSYDGVFRQSIALAGVYASGSPLPAAAVAWLSDQQCGPTPAAANGGFLGFRADVSVDCAAPDAMAFSGPDTNSTAVAAQALALAGHTVEVDLALDFLAAAKTPVGGFPYITGGDADPNSEALVIQAIVAGGEAPGTGRWANGADTPFTALLSWQIGTTGAADDQGAFASPFSSGFPDLYATRQAVWGAAGTPFPLTFDPYPDPIPSTTVPSSSATSVPTTSTTALPVVTPAFTG